MSGRGGGGGNSSHRFHQQVSFCLYIKCVRTFNKRTNRKRPTQKATYVLQANVLNLWAGEEGGEGRGEGGRSSFPLIVITNRDPKLFKLWYYFGINLTKYELKTHFGQIVTLIIQYQSQPQTIFIDFKPSQSPWLAQLNNGLFNGILGYTNSDRTVCSTSYIM